MQRLGLELRFRERVKVRIRAVNIDSGHGNLFVRLNCPVMTRMYDCV